jgi:hypothetical protein
MRNRVRPNLQRPIHKPRDTSHKPDPRRLAHRFPLDEASRPDASQVHKQPAMPRPLPQPSPSRKDRCAHYPPHPSRGRVMGRRHEPYTPRAYALQPGCPIHAQPHRAWVGRPKPPRKPPQLPPQKTSHPPKAGCHSDRSKEPPHSLPPKPGQDPHLIGQGFSPATDQPRKMRFRSGAPFMRSLTAHGWAAPTPRGRPHNSPPKTELSF